MLLSVLQLRLIHCREWILAPLITAAWILMLASLGWADCSALATADAGELLALPDNTSALGLLSPIVACTSSRALRSEQDRCNERIVVVQDRMLDSGHRILLTRPNQKRKPSGPDPRPFDVGTIYACVDDRVKSVYTLTTHNGGSINPIAPGEFTQLDSYLANGKPQSYATTFYWSEELHTYTSDRDITPPPPHHQNIPCADLGTIKAAQIIGLPDAREVWFSYSHGLGIYDDGEWEVTLEQDRMIGPKRRLIVLRRNHLRGAGAPDSLLIFTCMSGRVRPVFAEEFVELVEATDDKLVVTPYQEGSGPRMQTVITYRWRKGLGNYVMTGVSFRRPAIWPEP